MAQTQPAKFRLMAACVGLTMIAGCQTPPPPVAAPVPPPPVKIIPARPLPPGNATVNMYIPPRDLNGIRRTVNYGLSTPQTVWNLRSGLNVAALNCLDPKYAPILPAYRIFLDSRKRELRKASDDVQAFYRKEHGAQWRPKFDGYMTQVYNYYALPPAKVAFCDAALDIANDFVMLPDSELEAFAMANLPRLENVFDSFYTAMEQYRIAVANWDMEYDPAAALRSPTYSASGGASGFGNFAPSGDPVIRAIQVPASDAANMQPTPRLPDPTALTPTPSPAQSGSGTVQPLPAADTARSPYADTVFPIATPDYTLPPQGVSDATPVFVPGTTNTPVFVSNPVVEPIPAVEDAPDPE